MIYQYQAKSSEEIENFNLQLKNKYKWAEVCSLTTDFLYKKRGQSIYLIDTCFDTKINITIHQHAVSKLGECFCENFLKENNIKIIKPSDHTIYCGSQNVYDYVLKEKTQFKKLLSLRVKTFDADLKTDKFNIHIKVQDKLSREKLKVASWFYDKNNTLTSNKDLTFLCFLDTKNKLFQLEWILYTEQVVKHLFELPMFSHYNNTKKAIYAESPLENLRKNITDEINKGNIIPLSINEIS